MTKLLETINDPADLRQLPRAQLKAVADELRACVLDNVARTGGHLSSNLGTVELTVALHYVFNTPDDRKKSVTLVLRERKYNKKSKYRLVLRDADTDIEQQSVDVIIDRAFTDDF